MNTLKLLVPIAIVAALYWNHPWRGGDLTNDVKIDIFPDAEEAALREKEVAEWRGRMIVEKKRQREEDARYNTEVKAAEKDPRRKRGDNSYCKECDRFARVEQERSISRTSDHIRLSMMRVHCPECGNLTLLFREKP